MESGMSVPIDYRRKHNEQIEVERKEWHRRKCEESDEYREAYEFLKAQEKHICDQMAQVFLGINEGCRQIAQGIEPHPQKQKPESELSQSLRQEPDILNTITSPFSIGVLAMMFLAPESMQKALRRMTLCKEIFDADQQFRQRMYPISGWEI